MHKRQIKRILFSVGFSSKFNHSVDGHSLWKGFETAAFKLILRFNVSHTKNDCWDSCFFFFYSVTSITFSNNEMFKKTYHILQCFVLDSFYSAILRIIFFFSSIFTQTSQRESHTHVDLWHTYNRIGKSICRRVALWKIWVIKNSA